VTATGGVKSVQASFRFWVLIQAMSGAW
jgi:hypothetical protein